MYPDEVLLSGFFYSLAPYSVTIILHPKPRIIANLLADPTVYYEDLAVFLHEKGRYVCVELANKTKHFAQSFNIKTKTDKVDAKTSAQYGNQRNLKQGEPMSPQYKKPGDVYREKLSIQKELNRAENQLHAMAHSSSTSAHVMK